METDALLHRAEAVARLQLELGLAHLDQYFGLWAVEERVLRGMVEALNRLDLRTHVLESRAMKSEEPQTRMKESYVLTEDGTAIIELSGVLMKFVGSMAEGTSTVFTRRQVREAIDDPRVRRLILKVDSPGGTVSGVDDLAADVAAAQKRKPVTAFIEDLGASAAYYVASQAGEIVATRSSLVGGLGVFLAINDSSALAESLGVKVHVVRYGAFKGVGVPGTPITDEHLAEFQTLVDRYGEQFMEAVAAGRRMKTDAARELVDGRMHLADEAVTLRLIDRLATWDEVLSPNKQSSSTMRAEAPAGEAAQMEKSMSNETKLDATASPASPAAEAATFPQIKQECLGADAEFICGQLERQATVAQARTAWMAEQQKRLETARAETEQAKAATGRPGLHLLNDGPATRDGGSPETAGTAIEGFDAAVAAKMAAGLTKPKAIRAVVTEQPELHAAYLEECREQAERERGRNTRSRRTG